jgi:hypothetical protein
MKIYTAGPLGFSEAGRAFHEHTILPALASWSTSRSIRGT